MEAADLTNSHNTIDNGYTIKYHSSIKTKAIKLRRLGFSLSEISSQLKISKSTASLWLASTPLSIPILNNIREKLTKGRIKGLQTLAFQQNKKVQAINLEAIGTISSLNLRDVKLCKVLCSLLYWGEGSKTGYRLSLINSDPLMICFYMKLLRKSFPTVESKFRALVHIHQYHDETEIKKYWSNITQIPLSQFTKSYLKPHTGKIIRPGYKGAVRIDYYDSRIAHELIAIYNVLSQRL